MTVNPRFPIEASAMIDDLPFATTRKIILQKSHDWDVQIIEDSDDVVELEIPSLGKCSFNDAKTSTQIHITASHPDHLIQIQERLCRRLSQLLPKVAEDLRWLDSKPQLRRPPKLHFTTVQSITAIGSSFLRVRIKAEDLSSFKDEAIHFRILLPPTNCTEPEWPILAEDHSTIWPKGDKALHRPVYTTCWIDHQAGEMAFDVFLHDGGRVTNWVRGARAGDELVISGPGGGGVPQNSKVLMFADETGFPAVARILATLPENSQGYVTLIAAEGEACDYPIVAPKGVKLTWLARRDVTDLAERALAARSAFPDHFFWLASEKSEVSPVRKIIKAENPPPGTSYVAAYWTRR